MKDAARLDAPCAGAHAHVNRREDAHVTNPQDSYPDAPVLNEMRELTGRIRDQRTQTLLRSVIDAVALNPQPLPPRAHALLQAVIDALNPQPLPPGPPR